MRAAVSRLQVIVYPKEAQRPAKGEGLNKLCVYTMEGVWPKDKSTNERLRDARSLQVRLHSPYPRPRPKADH